MKMKTSLGLVVVLAAVLSLPATPSYATNSPETITSVTGSGTKYKTEVTRTEKGALSEGDLRQVSLLTGQVLEHVNDAIECFADMDKSGAEDALKKAQTLVGIVRDILPVTQVTTVVKNAQGKEVYQHSVNVQDDTIELFSEVAIIDVLNNILDTKKSEVQGPEYLGSVQLYTSVLADLGYMERKIQTALHLLDKPMEAHDQLMLAQINGVDMQFTQAESPLLEARRALELAENQVDQKMYAPAKDNLEQARLSLEAYRTLFGGTKDEAVKEITDQIKTLKKDMKEEGVSATIRECWNKTVQLFAHEHPNTAQATQPGNAPSK